MEGGTSALYTFLGFLVARLFTWLDNRSKYSFDSELGSLRLQNELLTKQNAQQAEQIERQEAQIVALTQRVAHLESLVSPVQPKSAS